MSGGTRPMRVGLIVDNPARDLAGLVLVADRLSARGAVGFLVPLYQQGVDVPLLDLDVVVANYVRPNNLPLLRAYAEAGTAVAVLDTEGGVLSEDGVDAPHNWARAAAAMGVGDLVARYCFWGEVAAAGFLETGALRPEQVRVTGCPRFDFCRPPLVGTLGGERRDYVLVNTNFSAINPRFSGSAASERTTFVGAGWEPAYVDRLLEDLHAVHPRYLDTVAEMAARLPDTIVLVRPHPFENAAFYERRFADAENIVVDGAGSVIPVIASSRCVVHLNCGTAVESALLGKVAINLEYLNTDLMRQHTPLPRKISYSASGLDDLVAAVTAPESLDGAVDREARYRAYVRPWFHEADGRAGERVADALLSLSPRARPRPLGVRLRSAAAGSAVRPRPGQRAQGLLGLALGSRTATALRDRFQPQGRAKRFGIAAVAAELAAIRRAYDEDSVPRVRHARHPLNGLPLVSIEIAPAAGEAGR